MIQTLAVWYVGTSCSLDALIVLVVQLRAILLISSSAASLQQQSKTNYEILSRFVFFGFVHNAICFSYLLCAWCLNWILLSAQYSLVFENGHSFSISIGRFSGFGRRLFDGSPTIILSPSPLETLANRRSVVFSFV